MTKKNVDVTTVSIGLRISYDHLMYPWCVVENYCKPLILNSIFPFESGIIEEGISGHGEHLSESSMRLVPLLNIVMVGLLDMKWFMQLHVNICC